MANYNSEQLVTLMVGRELGEQIDLGPRKIGARSPCRSKA
jgi:ribose transport system ATP-binding protein